MADIKIITGATGGKNVNAEDDRANNYGTYGVTGFLASDGCTFGTDGYLQGVNGITAQLVDSSTVRVSSGDIIMQGCHARIPYGQHIDLSVDPGTAGYNRVDCIVAEYTRDELGVESMSIDIVKGDNTTDAITADKLYPIITNVATGNIYKGDTLVREVLWTIVVSGTTVSAPVAYAGIVAPTGVLQSYTNALTLARNEDVVSLKKLGLWADDTRSKLNVSNWDTLTATEQISKIKEVLLNMCDAVQDLKNSELIERYLTKPYKGV